jgi:hypothetical protein
MNLMDKIVTSDTTAKANLSSLNLELLYPIPLKT